MPSGNGCPTSTTIGQTTVDWLVVRWWSIWIFAGNGRSVQRSAGEEHLVEMPLQELSAGSVGASFGQRDLVAGPGVEIGAVVELLAQTRADHEPVLRVDADVSAVVRRAHIGAEQQAVVEPVLAALRQRADVSGLEESTLSNYGRSEVDTTVTATI
jgi:hypothetical protein